MDHVGPLLKQTLAKRGLLQHAQAALLVTQAQEWLTERLPQQIEAIHVQACKDGVLMITVDHSIAAQEVQSCQVDLIDYLQQQGHAELESMRVVRA